MPESLVDSQMATLEAPIGEDDVAVIDAARPVDAILADIVGWIAGRPR